MIDLAVVTDRFESSIAKLVDALACHNECSVVMMSFFWDMP